jgi:hypothetical protein
VIADSANGSKRLESIRTATSDLPLLWTWRRIALNDADANRRLMQCSKALHSTVLRLIASSNFVGACIAKSRTQNFA